MARDKFQFRAQPNSQSDTRMPLINHENKKDAGSPS